MNHVARPVDRYRLKRPGDASCDVLQVCMWEDEGERRVLEERPTCKLLPAIADLLNRGDYESKAIDNPTSRSQTKNGVGPHLISDWSPGSLRTGPRDGQSVLMESIGVVYAPTYQFGNI